MRQSSPIRKIVIAINNVWTCIICLSSSESDCSDIFQPNFLGKKACSRASKIRTTPAKPNLYLHAESFAK